MNSLQIILTIIVFFFLILCIAFFASSETAFLSISNFTLRRMLRNNEKGAKYIAKLHAKMDSLLTVVLIGINFMSIFAASLGTAVAISIIGDHGVTIATLLVTFIITIGGEIVPKTIATERPVFIARKNAHVLLFLQKILFPLIWLFTKISEAAAAVTNRFWKQTEPLITEEELKTLIDVGTKEGTLEQSEQNMLYKIFEFSDLHVYDVMRHRSLIKAIPSTLSYKELVHKFTQFGFSRLPVYNGSIENITGILYYKRLLFSQKKERCENDFIKNNIEPALFVPESLTAIELLMQFKKTKNDFAVALDEQGCVSGIVTMDDLLRTVFGRMSDESSKAEIEPEKRIKIISANEFLVPGDMRLDDVNIIFKLHLVSEEIGRAHV